MCKIDIPTLFSAIFLAVMPQVIIRLALLSNPSRVLDGVVIDRTDAARAVHRGSVSWHRRRTLEAFGMYYKCVPGLQE